MSHPATDAQASQLAKAGRLLKSLTEQNKRLESEKAELLEQSKQSHTVNDTLVSLLEKATLDEPSATTPDVSTPDLLKAYLDQVQSRIEVSRKHLDKQREKDNGSADDKHNDKDALPSWSVEDVEKCLENIIRDPQNNALSDSLPKKLSEIIGNVQNQIRTQSELLRQSEETNNDSRTKAVEEAVKKTRIETEQEMVELRTTVQKITKDKEELESQIERNKQAMGTVDELQAKLKETEQRCSASDEKAAQLSEQAAKLKREQEELMGKLRPAVERMKSNEARAVALEKERDAIREERNIIQEERDAIQDSREQIQKELKSAQKELQRQKGEMEEQFAQKKQLTVLLEQRLEKTLQENDEYEMSVDRLKEDCKGLEAQVTSLSNELEAVRQKMEEDNIQMKKDRENVKNLESVLQTFEETKEAKIREIIQEYDQQLAMIKKVSAEYKERAEMAEAALENYDLDVSKTEHYEKEVREKNLLIGKLRHEAIILNEHLVEAMRRLKEETNESNVDRQLITNLLMGFLTAPRGDRRRYDILTIMANILELTDDQKERIGMIRGTRTDARTVPSSPGWQSPRRLPEDEAENELPDTQSFTDAWISFLLKQASTANKTPSTPTTPTLPQSPQDQHDVLK